jgi:hypothetical protein
MKAFLVATGTIFGLLTLAHVARVIDEGPHLLRDPWWVLVTLAAAVMCLWAWRLVLRRPDRSG